MLKQTKQSDTLCFLGLNKLNKQTDLKWQHNFFFICGGLCHLSTFKLYSVFWGLFLLYFILLFSCGKNITYV